MKRILTVAIMVFLLLMSVGMASAADSSSDVERPEDRAEFEDRSGGEDDTMSLSHSHKNQFEGIWKLNDRGENWIGITLSRNKIILLKYQPDQLASSLAGTVVGDVAFLGYATDASSFAAKMTLTSSNVATLVILRCEPKPDQNCSFPAGARFEITKVFD